MTAEQTEADEADFFVRISIAELEVLVDREFGHLPVLNSKTARREVIEKLRTRCFDDGFFEDAAAGVNVGNGFLALDGEGQLALWPHSPNWKARFKLAAGYDSTASTEWLDEALTRSLPSLTSRQALQEFAGSILFGTTPAGDALRRIAILHGPRSSGKSTIIEILAALVPSEVIGSVPPGEWAKETYRAALEGVVLNIVTELGGSTRIGGEHMKKIASGEPVSARRMRCDPFYYRPIARHLFATNEMPRIADTSDAFERRLLVINFTRSLGEAEMDKDFGKRLQAEPSAIICWAAEGAARLLRNGRFTLPDDHAISMAKVQHGNDLTMVFAHTQIRRAPGARITTNDLRVRYHAYLEAQGVGHDTMDNGAISRIADYVQKVLGSTRRKANGRPFYEEVAFVEPDTLAASESPEGLSGL